MKNDIELRIEKNSLYIKLMFNELSNFGDKLTLIRTYLDEIKFDENQNAIIDLRELDYDKCKECLKLFTFLDDMTNILDQSSINRRVILSEDYILNCKIFEQFMIRNINYKKIEFKENLEDAFDFLGH